MQAVSIKRQFIYLILALALVAAAVTAEAFVRSEEALMRAEITEAKDRANDFKRQQERAARLDAERERTVDQIKQKRQREEEAQERARLKYVEKAREREVESQMQEKLEKSYEAQQLAEQEKMERRRLDYLRKRERVREVIEREAHINEAEEYDIHPF